MQPKTAKMHLGRGGGGLKICDQNEGGGVTTPSRSANVNESKVHLYHRKMTIPTNVHKIGALLSSICRDKWICTIPIMSDFVFIYKFKISKSLNKVIVWSTVLRWSDIETRYKTRSPWGSTLPIPWGQRSKFTNSVGVTTGYRGWIIQEARASSSLYTCCLSVLWHATSCQGAPIRGNYRIGYIYAKSYRVL